MRKWNTKYYLAILMVCGGCYSPPSWNYSCIKNADSRFSSAKLCYVNDTPSLNFDILFISTKTKIYSYMNLHKNYFSNSNISLQIDNILYDKIGEVCAGDQHMILSDEIVEQLLHAVAAEKPINLIYNGDSIPIDVSKVGTNYKKFMNNNHLLKKIIDAIW